MLVYLLHGQKKHDFMNLGYTYQFEFSFTRRAVENEETITGTEGREGYILPRMARSELKYGSLKRNASKDQNVSRQD